MILKAGRVDAESSARLLGAVDPLAVKHTVSDQAAEGRTHPTFFPLLEQWERHTQAIQTLRTGQAFIRLPDDSVHRMHTPTLPRITVAPERLAAVRERLAAVRECYLHTHFVRCPASTPQPRPCSRRPRRPRPPRSGSDRGFAGPPGQASRTNR